MAEPTRVVTCKIGTTSEAVYLIPDLPPAQASPVRLLELIREHWAIGMLYKLWKQYERIDAWKTANR